MSTKLQHRALRSQPQAHELMDHPRFTSMIVPIDRSTRDDGGQRESEEIEIPVLLDLPVSEAKQPNWLAIAATALTVVLLFPILCLALFPVSILALAFTPVVAGVYACSIGLRRDDARGTQSNESESLPISRAA